MGSKNKPGAFDCYAAAHPDEPMFVLLGRDPLAADLIRQWVRLREQQKDAEVRLAFLGEGVDLDALREGVVRNNLKCEEALACADAMEEWAKLPHHRARPGEIALAYDGLVLPGYYAQESYTMERAFKGQSAERIPGIDYRAFAIQHVIVGRTVSRPWVWSKVSWPATDLFEPWASSMDVAGAGQSITITLKNVSEVPQKFAVKIVGLSLED